MDLAGNQTNELSLEVSSDSEWATKGSKLKNINVVVIKN